MLHAPAGTADYAGRGYGSARTDGALMRSRVGQAISAGAVFADSPVSAVCQCIAVCSAQLASCLTVQDRIERPQSECNKHRRRRLSTCYSLPDMADFSIALLANKTIHRHHTANAIRQTWQADA